jgi:hypothetical protein
MDDSGSGHGGPDFTSKQEETYFFDRAAGFCALLDDLYNIQDAELTVGESVDNYALAVGRWAKKFGLYLLKSGT